MGVRDPEKTVDHVVDQLRAGFGSSTGRKCDTCKALEVSTPWFGTRRSKVQILSPDHSQNASRLGRSPISKRARGQSRLCSAGLRSIPAVSSKGQGHAAEGRGRGAMEPVRQGARLQETGTLEGGSY